MILDSENHRKQILGLLTMPGLSINPDGDKDLEQAARDHLSLLEAVRAASVGACECRNAGFAHVLTELETPEG